MPIQGQAVESTSVDPFTRLLALEMLPSFEQALAVELLCYGVHVVLFFICVYVLLKRRATLQYVILISATIMFALSTADVAITLRLMLKDYPALLLGRTTLSIAAQRVYPKNPIFVTNNFIADLLLIYRCYTVWGKRQVIIVISVVLLLSDTIWGWIGAGIPFLLIKPRDTSTFLWSVFAMNTAMTALTAGRIWWVSRRAKAFIGKQHLCAYNTAIAILIESGLLYSITILITLLAPPVIFKMTMYVILYRIVAIVPTLIIVQVGLGRHFLLSDAESVVPGEASTGPAILDTIITAGEVETDNQSLHQAEIQHRLVTGQI